MIMFVKTSQASAQHLLGKCQYKMSVYLLIDYKIGSIKTISLKPRDIFDSSVLLTCLQPSLQPYFLVLVTMYFMIQQQQITESHMLSLCSFPPCYNALLHC